MAQRYKILIVDDDELARIALSRMLQREGATTESFALIKGGPRTMWYEPVTAWSLNIYVNARDDD